VLQAGGGLQDRGGLPTALAQDLICRLVARGPSLRHCLWLLLHAWLGLPPVVGGAAAGASQVRELLLGAYTVACGQHIPHLTPLWRPRDCQGRDVAVRGRLCLDPHLDSAGTCGVR
jgi:hypothetical protein